MSATIPTIPTIPTITAPEKAEELVLVIPTHFAHQVIAATGDNQTFPPPAGFYPTAKESTSQLRQRSTFASRDGAEHNPTLKQLVVYALLRCNGKTLCYKRGKVGGEARLHAQRSIGVGGHINPVDWRVELTDHRAFGVALQRELEEEIGIAPDHPYSFQFLGFVNEDTTDVGRVHLGLVYAVDLDPALVHELEFEDALVDPQWLTDAELSLADSLELWSSLIRDGLVGKITGVDWGGRELAPHELRVVAERADLDARLEKLDHFIKGTRTFDDLPAEDRELLVAQYGVMFALSLILKQRIARFVA